jgi:hypothetical protein
MAQRHYETVAACVPAETAEAFRAFCAAQGSNVNRTLKRFITASIESTA